VITGLVLVGLSGGDMQNAANWENLGPALPSRMSAEVGWSASDALKLS